MRAVAILILLFVCRADAAPPADEPERKTRFETRTVNGREQTVVIDNRLPWRSSSSVQIVSTRFPTANEFKKFDAIIYPSSKEFGKLNYLDLSLPKNIIVSDSPLDYPVQILKSRRIKFESRYGFLEAQIRESVSTILKKNPNARIAVLSFYHPVYFNGPVEFYLLSGIDRAIRMSKTKSEISVTIFADNNTAFQRQLVEEYKLRKLEAKQIDKGINPRNMDLEFIAGKNYDQARETEYFLDYLRRMFEKTGLATDRDGEIIDVNECVKRILVQDFKPPQFWIVPKGVAKAFQKTMLAIFRNGSLDFPRVEATVKGIVRRDHREYNDEQLQVETDKILEKFGRSRIDFFSRIAIFSEIMNEKTTSNKIRNVIERAIKR